MESDSAERDQPVVSSADKIIAHNTMDALRQRTISGSGPGEAFSTSPPLVTDTAAVDRTAAGMASSAAPSADTGLPAATAAMTAFAAANSMAAASTVAGISTSSHQRQQQLVPMPWPAGAPAAVPAPPAGYGSHPAPPPNELRTVFLVGFPSDFKVRELHNLLKFLPGYEACQFHSTYPSPTGFALFQSRVHALDAIAMLNGDEFEEGVFLRAEPARKNLFLKPNDPTIRFAVKTKGHEILIPTAGTTLNGSLAPVTPEPPMLLWAPAAPGALATAMAHSGGAAGAAAAAAACGQPVVLPAGGGVQQGVTGWVSLGFAPVTNLNDNPPCNTLFIGNLSSEIEEADLRAVMQPQPGFKHLQLNDTGKGKVCFVEFTDVPSAAYVHETLQGVQVPSNGRGGLRIQYSRNPFGQRRQPIMPTSNNGNAAGAYNRAGPALQDMHLAFMGSAGQAMPGAMMASDAGAVGHQLLLPGMQAVAASAGMVRTGMGLPAMACAQHGGLFGGEAAGGAAAAAVLGHGGMQRVTNNMAMAAGVAEVTQGMAATSLFGQPLAQFVGF